MGRPRDSTAFARSANHPPCRRLTNRVALALGLVAALGGSALAQPVDSESDDESTRPEGPVRRKDATLGEVFSGPFQSSRLFDMPIADVVGAYQIALSGDGSLLRETGILSSAGVLAIGFGDIAQLEYRHTAVIGVGKFQAPIPAYGVQLKAPYHDHKYLPALAIAFRLGRDRSEELDNLEVVENVTDLYVVGRLKLWGPLRIASLHGGVRFSSVEMSVAGWDQEAKRTMYLPAGGWEIRMNRRTRLIGEAALVPTFELRPNANTASQYEPRITYGVLGRMGIRWHVHPSFAIDASIGYQLEVAKLEGSEDRGLSSVVDWDMRLGGEFHFPWGALVCRASGTFCD